MVRTFAIALTVLIPLTHEGNVSVTNRDGDATERQGPPVLMASLGAEHACGLASDGRAYCWGSNRLGQLTIDPSPLVRP